MRPLLPLALLAVPALLVACDDTSFTLETVTPAGTDYCAAQEIIAVECAGCHTNGGTTGGLNMDDLHAAVVGVESSLNASLLVTAGSKEDSLLYRKIAGTQASDEGGPMPPGGMDQDAIDVIGAWIDDGATTACDGVEGDADTDSDADSDTDSDTDADVEAQTWCAVQAVFDDNCLDCHDSASYTGYSHADLETDAYANLVGRPSAQWPDRYRVVPYYPEASLLMRKVSHTQAEDEGAGMPDGGEPISSDDQETIRSWIAAGALPEDCQ